jgi:hypothetical protein
LFQQTLQLIERNRERRISGKENCIPNPFPRMASEWAGIEKAKYIGVTASSKVGKSQITDFMFVYHPINYILEGRSNFDIKVLYFSLEMSKEQKTLQAISHYLYKFYNILIAPKDLRSLNNILDANIFKNIKELEPFFKQYFTKIHYIDNIRNRYGIWREIYNYAEANGKIIKETREFDGKKVEVIKEYIPNNPDEIVIPLVDHASLLNPETGKDLFQAINELSSNDFVKARNLFGYSPVLIQQQMSAQENLEHKKADALMPSLAGLADNKNTQRDWDVGLGLFSPARHGMNTFKGYDITKLGNRFRSMEILANREGDGNTLVPLLFKGECSHFEELPLPDTKEYKEFIKSFN